jgi:large subunit ribosomal protein L13
MQKLTKPTSSAVIRRNWYLFDVKNKILGRVSAEIAKTLMGKAKPYYVPNLDCGDHVVVINAKHVKVTGHKEKEKMYSNYSGYPGGLKQKPLWVIRSERPTQLVTRAVYGMLPKNKLRARLKTRLYVYPETDHPYAEKFKKS